MGTGPIRGKIRELKKKRSAVILAHNYQPGEIQEAADFTGDSLGLSRIAAGTEKKIIVFCGVRFMAETAKILSPEQTVLIPDEDAGCPMAGMVTRTGLKELKAKHPGAVTVGYVNTTADVKTEIDVCCTSGNAVKVINSIEKDKEIIFVPDKYLAAYVSRKTGREFITWNGYCPVHAGILPEHVLKAKKYNPGAVFIAHPECRREVIELASEALSTEGMIEFAKKSSADKIIIGTETGMLYRLKKENPDKEFIPAYPGAICANMKKITLEKLLAALDELKHEIILPEEVMRKAKKCVARMVQAV